MAAAAGGRAVFTSEANAQTPASNPNPNDTFRLGIAGYTFNKFKLDRPSRC